MNNEEIWKDIKGFNEYKISNLGRVIRHTTGYIPFNNSSGYERIKLWSYDRYYYRQVHQIVAEAFLDNPNGYRYVRHKNGNHHDNRVINLEFYSC
jgi:hypothetical protein